MKPKRVDSQNPFPDAAQSAPFALELAAYRTVEALRLYGRLSRTSIAEMIGYSPSKLTSVVNTLIENGVLEEVGDGASSGGRRARVMDFNPNYAHIVVASVQADQMDVALVDFRGGVRVRRMFPLSPSQPPQTVLSTMSSFIFGRLEQLNISPARVCGVGITTPLAVDRSTATLIDSPALPGWGGYQLDSHLRELFPYSTVTIEKDANAMALGELRRGAAGGASSLVYLKFGASISAGLVVNGAIYRGASGRAGEVASLNDDPGQQAARLAELIAFIDPDVVVLGADVYAPPAELTAALNQHLMTLSGAGIASRRLKQPALGAEAAMVGMVARVAESIFTLNAR